MPEHRIRFRGGWELIGTVLAPSRRLSLPLDSPTGLAGPIRLVRRFGRPPVDPATESIRLELRRVPGLRAIVLNEVDLGNPAGLSEHDVPLKDPLAARSALILAVDFPSDSDWPAEGWGAIALVIAPLRG